MVYVSYLTQNLYEHILDGPYFAKKKFQASTLMVTLDFILLNNNSRK